MAAESSAYTEMRNWKDTTLSLALQPVISAPLFREEKQLKLPSADATIDSDNTSATNAKRPH